MNLADVFRGLLRRWYIVIPGILVAIAVSVTLWLVIKPGYERSATQLLLPGEGTLPVETANPYLYIGGLSQAADVLVRTVGSESVIDRITLGYPDTDVTVSRDPSTAGPLMLISVTASSDGAARVVLNRLVRETETTLVELQSEQNIVEKNRITLSTLAVDEKSTLQQRSRLVMSAGAGALLLLLTLLLASVVDGLARRVHPAGRAGRRKPGADDAFVDDAESATSDEAEDDVPDDPTGSEVEPELMTELLTPEPTGAAVGGGAHHHSRKARARAAERTGGKPKAPADDVQS